MVLCAWPSSVEMSSLSGRPSIAWDSGTVWINKHIEILPHIPFGGAKQSGIGVELAEDGLNEFTQLQVINR